MSGPNPPEGRRRPRRGRWRVALRYASRDARRHKGRTALVAIMVALPAGLGAATSVLVSSTWSGPASEVDSRLGSDATVQAEVSTFSPVEVFQDPNEHMFGSDGEASSIPGDLFVDRRKPTDPDDQSTYPPVDRSRYESALARAVPSNDQVVPVATLFGVRVAAADHPDLRTSVQAHQLDTTTAARAAYDLPTALGPGEIALGRSVASDLHVAVGDRVTVALPAPGHGSYEVYDGNGSFRTLSHRSTTPAGTFTVQALLGRSKPDAAVFGSAGPLAVPRQLAPWTPDARSADGGEPTVTWLVVGDEPVTWTDVRRVNDLGATAFSRREVLHPSPEAEAFVKAEFADDGTSVSTDVAAVVGGAVALGLLQAILMIGPAFQVGARRASRDLALLAAAGADARTIRRTVLAGGLVIGVAASLTSAAIGAGAAGVALRLWTSAQVVLPWPWLVAFILVGTLIAVAAAWLPARRASRLDPVLVLAGRRADPPPRRWPAVAGGVLAVLGTVVALVGAVTGRQVLVLVAGIVLAEIGLVLAAGSIVGGLARLARPLGGTTRLALRDAARQRARTAPAVAAVLAACAAATAGLVFAGSQAQHDRLSYVPDAATGTFLVGTLGDPGHGLTPDTVDTITSLVDDADLVTGPLLPVKAVTGDGSSSTAVWVLPPKATRGDTVAYAFSASGTVVDDGTSLELLQLLGVPEPSKAAAALRAEKIVVSPTDLGDDGTATLSIEDARAEGGSRTVTVPAAAVGDGIGAPTNLPLIPTDVAQDLGLRTRTSALVAPVRDGAWSTAVQNSLDDALVAALPAHENQGGGLRYAAASAYVEPGHASWSGSQELAELLIVAGALIVALAAAWIATALAGTESLPDLATLQAVGAPPRTRRRFAAAQSAVITVTGAVLGAGTGLVIGATLVLSQRERGDAVDPRWMIDVPWLWVAALVVAIPLLGAAAAWLVTRSRLPLARRLDG